MAGPWQQAEAGRYAADHASAEDGEGACIIVSALQPTPESSHTRWLQFIFLKKCRSQVGAEVVECACVVEMPDLGGRKKLGDVPLYAQVQKEGD